MQYRVHNMKDGLPFSQASENNQTPILDVLAPRMTEPVRILEIGTGTGQHAVHFARALPQVHWIPSDHPDNLWMGAERLASSELPNIASPLPLDVAREPWDCPSFDHAYSANTAHIMSVEEVGAMFRGLAQRLPVGGCLYLYGPFNYDNQYTSEGNRRFDQHLRQRSPRMGIRDLAELTGLAVPLGFKLDEDLSMPANNRLLVFRLEQPPH